MDEQKDDAKKAGPRTVIDEGTTFKGALVSKLPILVHGRVEGTVEASGVTVSAEGSLAGKVTTDVLRSIGKIGGEYDVKSAQIAGSVEDRTRVRAESIQLKLTAPTGRLEVTFGSAPEPPEGTT